MNRNEMVEYIRDALQTYASEINWDFHPKSDRFWNFEGAIHYSLIRKTNAKNILEVGTEYGISTRFLVEAAVKNDGNVLTLDTNSEHSLTAKFNLPDLPIRFVTMDCRDYKTYMPKYDFIFYDGNHEGYMVNWYKKILIPRTKGWFVAHDIDVGSLVDSRTDGEFNEFPKQFKDQYITAREMMGHTSYRPPFEGDDSGWMNGSAYIYVE